MKLLKAIGIGGWRFRAIGALMLLAMLAPGARAGLRPWEPSDYVQTDLVLHYDGIRNAGANAAHDPAATTWKDLSPSGNDASTYVHSSASNNGAWGNKGFVFATDGYWKADKRTSVSGDFTMQVACDTTQSSMQGTKSWPNLIGNNGAGASGNTDELTIFYHKGNKRLSAKFLATYLDQYLSGWNCKYATLLRSGAQASLFDGTEPSLVATSKTGNIGADILVGSGTTDKNDGGSGDRRFTGTIYSVRIYDKALSNTELAWNRALDEARFHGAASVPESALCAACVPDAVIASSVAGVEGAEVNGCYVVDKDGYTFRAAPFASVGGKTYALSGYTLAAWNGSDWGEAVQHNSEYSVFVKQGDKVKITWLWEAASGSLDAGYVADDLALRLDGIDNAGVGVHNASATVWKDLSGNGRDAYLAGNADGTSHWTDKGFYFNRNAVFATTAQFQLGNRYTIEGLVDSAKTDYPTSGVNGQVFCNSVNNLRSANSPSYNGWLYYHKNQGKWMFLAGDVTEAGWGAANTTLSDDTLSYFTAFRDGPLVALTTADALPASGNWAGKTKDDVPPDDIWCFGANSATAVRSSNQWNFKGTVKSFRAYTRLLTNEELARNRAVDNFRFFGKVPPTGCVVVQSAIDGLEGREPNGIYFPDGWTFTAGSATNTVRDIGWVCAGYQLQTWDAATSTWGTQQTVLCDGGNVAEYTPSGTSFASVRITWLWKPVAGIRTAADYALADYAVGGLQLHLDGLLNTGAAHDSSATVWSDLSGNGRDATLAGNPSGESHWTDKGYFFASNAVFTTDNSTAGIFSLGHAYTMQTLGEVNFADLIPGGATHNGTFVSPISHVGYGSIWLKGDGMGTIQHHTSDTTGAAWNLRGSVFVGLDGHPTYLTAIRNGNRAALVEGTAYPTTENTMAHQACMDWSVGSKDEAAPATRWGVGALTGGGGGDPLYGTIKSVRLYDRMLSEDELAWNRSVDSARFFGALTTTNVVEVISGVEKAYKVEGEWTFNAPATVTIDNTEKKVAGYRLEVWDSGVWKRKPFQRELSFRYSEDDEEVGGKTVKLIWSPEPEGLMIIIR